MNRILMCRRKHRKKTWRSLRQYRWRQKRAEVKLRILLCTVLCAEISAISGIRLLDRVEKEEAAMLPAVQNHVRDRNLAFGNGSLFGFTISWKEGRLIVYKIRISSREPDSPTEK